MNLAPPSPLREHRITSLLGGGRLPTRRNIIPHTVYGDAGALNYRCANRHMKREPYYVGFDAQGYQQGNWQPVR